MLIELESVKQLSFSIVNLHFFLQPSTNETRPFVSSWENRINFLASGFVQLQHITLNDEGTYHCESNSYEIHPDTDVKWYTSVIVHGKFSPRQVKYIPWG